MTRGVDRRVAARHRVIAAIAVVTMALLTSFVSVRAHEIGTTRVSVTFTRSAYQIDIVTNAAALAEKLTAVSGDAAIGLPADADALRARIATADATFRRRLAVRFDGAAVEPAITYTVVNGQDRIAPPLAKIRLTGSTPDGARAFDWRYGWTFATYALVVTRADGGAPSSEWLEGGDTSRTYSLDGFVEADGRWQVAARYLALGFTHIVPHGLDHMLFVLGLFLLTRRLRAMLWQVSAFTIAHTITLGLSVYGVVSISPAVVEPLIALSIAYVAIENVIAADLTLRRIALVFLFGLLHGLGFAGALGDVGLPRSAFATALVSFNLGVEAGQLAVLGAALALAGWSARRSWYRRRVVIPASAVIAGLAVFWVVERL